MQRLELHLGLPEAAPAAAARPAIAAATVVGNLIISSGQTAHRDGVNLAEGLVGADVTLEVARDCAWQCARNVVDALAATLGDLERIVAVRRVTVYVASAPGFTRQHLVADAASEYVLRVFGEAGVHARAAIGVAALPTASPVEVELIAEVRGG